MCGHEKICPHQGGAEFASFSRSVQKKIYLAVDTAFYLFVPS